MSSWQNSGGSFAMSTEKFERIVATLQLMGYGIYELDWGNLGVEGQLVMESDIRIRRGRKQIEPSLTFGRTGWFMTYTSNLVAYKRVDWDRLTLHAVLEWDDRLFEHLKEG